MMNLKMIIYFDDTTNCIGECVHRVCILECYLSALACFSLQMCIAEIKSYTKPQLTIQEVMRATLLVLGEREDTLKVRLMFITRVQHNA